MICKRKRRNDSDCSTLSTSSTAAEGRAQQSFRLNPENTCSTSDIPGFFYDEDKKRYFRLLPGNNNHNPLTVESISASKIEKLRTQPKFPRQCLPVALSNPLRGFTSPTAFSILVQQGRMSNFKCVNRVTTESVIELTADKCKYLYSRAEHGIVVGAWASEKDGFVIHSLSAFSHSDNDLTVNRGSVVNIHPYSFQLADLSVVEVSPKLFFALYAGNYPNHLKEPRSAIHLLPIRDQCDQSTPENRELMDSRSQNYEFVRKHLWSCSFNEHSMTIFAGGESKIYHFNVENALSSEYSINNETIFSLATSANGQTLFAGTNKGQLTWFDTRNKNAVGTLKIGRGVSYLKVLTDEHKMVVSSYDDNLAQVDLREKKILFNYPEHANKHRKLPFSVDELTGILCSVGQDRITHLWSLRDGKMLTAILPPENTDSSAEVWAWYSDHWNIKYGAPRSSLVMSTEKEIMLYAPE